MDKTKEEAVILFLKSQTDTLRKYEDLINKERVNGDVVTLTSRAFLLNLLDNLACSEVIIYGYKINVLEKENIEFLYYYLISNFSTCKDESLNRFSGISKQTASP